jgi:hypothetical protein
MNGVRRLHTGQGHEVAVAERLRTHGWDVHPWGQGLFDDGTVGELVRAALVTHEPKTFWRWIPDLIAVQGNKIRLVDPKHDERADTENFSIEVDAYMAHQAMRGLGLPIVYVWQDMTCNTPAGLFVHRWELVPQRGKNRGSGTPYALVYKADQHPLEWAFGSASRSEAG